MKRLYSLFKDIFGTEPTGTEQIKGSGSARAYFRLTDGINSAIGVIGTSVEENNAFIGLTKHFETKGLPVPRILNVTDDQMAYLQTDLGKTSLYDAISAGRENGGQYSDEEKELLHHTIRLLPAMQIRGAENLDTSLCYPTPAMDSTSIHFDLNYFKYCFLKLLPSIDFNEILLEHDFDFLCNDILSICNKSKTIILRDCQARNIMLKNSDGEKSPNFIDYQGCRLGPAEYDLASFLWQSSSRYPVSLREELIKTYIESYNKIRPCSEDEIRHNLQLMVLFRILQVLGAYGFRGYIEHKSYFLNSIPPAINNLSQLLYSGIVQPYPYLESILNKIVGCIKAQEEAKRKESTPKTNTEATEPLTVTIYSFSYKKGIPEDKSGNGGGYVFDCRSTHNPGRYEPYKKITGLDAPVIKFLEDDGEILTFLSHIYPLAKAHTERYISRGFTSLMFCFGCTGGQHRSVYSAQHVAEYLRSLYPQIRIHLIHREQGIDTYL